MVKDYPLDITAVPFGRRGAGCMVFCEENGEGLDAENGLYLSQSTEGVLMGGAQFLRNKNYLLITPMKNGEKIAYTYTATTSNIQIEGGGGRIYITFSPEGTLRIWSQGLAIRLTAKMGFGDVAMKRGRAAQIEMDGAVYFIVPVKGEIAVDSHYNLLTYRYTDPVIDLIPGNGVLDIAVCDRSLPADEAPGTGKTFSECVAAMSGDFSRFAESIVRVPEGLETLIYSLWAQEKSFKEGGVMYPSNVITAVYPIAAEQPVLSLAFRDADTAAGLITNFARYATGLGLIPEYVTKTKKLYQTVSMYYGYGVLQLLEDDGLSDTELADIYDMLCTVDSWWTQNRSYDGGVSFFYAYPFECGDVKSSVLADKMPAVTPDLMTKMALSAFALAECGARLNMEKAAERWRNTAARRLEYLTDKLWLDGRFVCRDKSGTAYASESILCCTPVLLGEKLPSDQAEKTAELIMDKFFVPGRGLLTEESGDKTDTVLTALLTAGLCDAGRKDLGKRLAGDMRECISRYGLYSEYPAAGKPARRCGSLYSPAASAAVLYAAHRAFK